MFAIKISLVLLALSLAGCGEAEFAGGFATGVAAMAQMAEGAQDEFITAIDTLDAQTAELNALAGSYEGLVKPETIAAIEKAKIMVKEGKDDPWKLGSLISAAILLFASGRKTTQYIPLGGSKKKPE